MSSTFLRIGDVQGDASDPQHLGWIEAISFQNPVQNRNELLIAKTTDSASAALHQMAQDGKQFDGEMDAVDNGRIYLHFTLKGAVITALRYSASNSDDTPLESLTLDCQGIDVDFR